MEPYNLSILRKLEEYGEEASSRKVWLGEEPHHLDVVVFGCAPTPSNPDGSYVHVDALRAICNSPATVDEVRFHLNCVDSFDAPYLLDRTAAFIEAYMRVLLPFEDYKKVPDWYTTIGLGLPALGLVDYAVLNRKGLLKKTALGAAMLTAGALWEAIANLPVALSNALAAALRRKYERLASQLRSRSINASFLERSLIPRSPGDDEPRYIAIRDNFTSPQDPFPKAMFKGLLLLLADAVALERTSAVSANDVRFYARTARKTRHYHPEMLAVSEDVLRAVRERGHAL